MFEHILEEYADRQGWNEYSRNKLLLMFLEHHAERQPDLGVEMAHDFEKFLQEAAELENSYSLETGPHVDHGVVD